MVYKNEADDSLEKLLESLILMVGRTNQNIDALQKRISQLESVWQEHQPCGRKQFILTKAAEKQ